MNEQLKNHHFEMLTDEHARHVYDMLAEACDGRANGLTDADQLLIADYCFAEQMKAQLKADIAERGIGKMCHNGRQTYWKTNESIKECRDQVKLQALLLGELKLTAKARKAEPAEVGDDFDSFE